MVSRLLVQSVAVAAVVALSGSAARADFIIDTFATPNPAHVYSLSTAGTTTNFSDTLPGGITRSTTVTLFSGSFPNAATGVLGNAGASGQVFSLSTAAASKGYASLKYTYSSPQDLSAAGTDLALTFAFADQNVPFTVRLTTTGGQSVQSGVVTASGAGVYTIPMSSFTGVNLSQVTAIELVLNRDETLPPASQDGSIVAAADVFLTEVAVRTPNVPAPPALALVLAALPALGLARVVRRRKAAV